MGLFDVLRRPATLLPPRIVSPYSPSDALETLTTADLYPDLPNALTREQALKIPAVKRSHDVVCGVLARMPWVCFDDTTRVEPQPSWLVTSSTGLPPRDLRWGVYSDLFMTGWAAIGFELENDYPIDALHLPYGTWGFDDAGEPIVTFNGIPAKYQQRIVPIRLGYGSNGLLFDGYDTLDAARSIETAYKDRIENPIAQTTLTLAGDRWDGWDRTEREEFRQLWIAGRSAKGGATAMKPDWVTVDYSGELPTDLFESGRNANRLDIANHAGLPAALLEGSKQSAGGDIHYSTEVSAPGAGTRNELWDFGLAKYADAIESRLSLDDISEPGQSIRVDPGNYLTAPTPTRPLTSED